MSKYILNTLSKEYPIEVTVKHMREIYSILIDFETRRDHPLTLNSQLVGVHPIAFVPKDTAAIFDVFNVDRHEFSKVLNTIVDNKGNPIINRDFNVTGNTFNNFIVWMFYRIVNSPSLSRKNQELTLFYLSKLWLYKFLTSRINRNFKKYKCSEALMQATINNLTQKSDIIRYGTWKAVIEAQCIKFSESSNLHYRTIHEFYDDKKVFYLMSDTQTRIRDKLKNIFAILMNTKELGDQLGSYSSTADIDGEKIIVNQISTFDIMINSILSELTNTSSFIEDKLIKVVAALFSNVKEDMLKSLLVKYCILAESQIKSGDIDKVVQIRKDELFVGARALVKQIIQKSYRFCIKKNLNMQNKIEILNSVKNIYSSSRITDSNLVQIKDSVNYFIERHGNTRRQATISSLRISFILYIMCKTLRHL